MNLFEINAEIMACVNEDGEVIDPEKLDALVMERDDKIQNIALYIKNLNAEAAALKAEKQAFVERQKQAERKAESLKQYLSSFLNGQKFKSTKVSVSFRKSVVLNITEEAVIPEEYLKYADPEVKVSELKEAVKNGLQITGVTLQEKQNLQIK